LAHALEVVTQQAVTVAPRQWRVHVRPTGKGFVQVSLNKSWTTKGEKDMKTSIQLVAGIVITLCVVASSGAQENSQTAERLRNEASGLLAQGKISNAVDRLKEAVAADPKSDQCWLDLEDAMGRLHEGKVPLDARDGMIKAYPLSAMPHVFKAVALFKDDQFSQADDEFAKAMKLEPRSPYVYGYMFQIHTLNGEYEKALGDHKMYTDLGGAKIFEGVARQYGFLLLALDRQFNGKNLPAASWRMPEDFSAIAELSSAGMPFLLWVLRNVQDPKVVLGDASAKGSNLKYTYRGSEDSPLKYAPGLYIWDGTVLVTPQDGILLLNGTKLKHVSVVHGIRTTRVGVVRDWRFEFEQKPLTK